MKRHYKWLALGLVLVLIAFSVVRALSARKAQQEALAQAGVAKVQAVVELAASRRDQGRNARAGAGPADLRLAQGHQLGARQGAGRGRTARA